MFGYLEHRPGSRMTAALATLTIWLGLVSPSSQAEDSDLVHVLSAQAYLAKRIDTGEAVGHFLHIRTNVLLTESTRSMLSSARAMPTTLAARLEVDGEHLLQCGIGGYLTEFPSIRSVLRLLLQEGSSEPAALKESGEIIWPLFYSPEGALNGSSEVDLILVMEPAGGGWIGPPIARAPVPWNQKLMDEASAARVEHVRVGADSEAPGATRSKRTFGLRFPVGLTRVLGGRKSELYCGTELVKDFVSIGPSPDVVGARLGSPNEAMNCKWELRFPDVGVKLELDISEP